MNTPPPYDSNAPPQSTYAQQEAPSYGQQPQGYAQQQSYPPQQYQQQPSYGQQPQGYPQGGYNSVVVGVQPPMTSTMVVNVSQVPGENDVMPSIIIFVLGWFFCYVWLGGFAYFKSVNQTARMLGIASIVLYFTWSVCGIIWIIYGAVAASTAASHYCNYTYYNSYYNTYSYDC